MATKTVVIASSRERQTWLERFTPGDVVTPALYYLVGSVNAKLRGLTDTRLYPEEAEQRARKGGGTQPRLRSRIVPNSLLGGLWLQFHQSIAVNAEYRRCDICKGWFEISAGVNRATKVHCGDACRTQAYRDRQRRAAELHDQEWSYAAIAKELGSDIPTVKKWVSNRKG